MTASSGSGLKERIERDMAERRAEYERRRRELGVDCLTCKDTGICGDASFERFCDCERGQAALQAAHARWRTDRATAFRDALDAELAVPLRFRDLGFETFPDQRSAVLRAVRAWIEGHAGRSGVFLTGPFGRGKSSLLVGMLRSLVLTEAERRDFAAGRFSTTAQPPYYQPADSARPRLLAAATLGGFVTGTGLLQSLRPRDEGYRRRDSTNEDALRRYQQVTFLAIDDLGAERLTEWGADRLFEIVNERHNELRPMLLSSNLTPNALATRWNQQVGDGESGDRIINRIIESCDVIGFDDSAPNWRMQRKR